MTEYGVTETGFVPKPQDVILAELQALQVAAPEIGPTQDFSSASALGQLNGIVSGIVAELHELAGAVWASNDPDAAFGLGLEVLCSLTGTLKRGASPSRAACTVNLDAGVTLAAGKRASVVGRPDIVFELETDVTNPGGSPANVPAIFVCTATGPVAANAGTLTVIDTTTGGWNSITNPEDAVRGRNVDTPIQLRQRREDQLALRGGSTLRAIQADLLDSENHPELDGIESVYTLENTTAVVDSNGLPPHTIEVIIDDGEVPAVDDDDVAQSIWDAPKAGGIGTYGAESGTAVDANGDDHVVRFSRRTGVDIYVTYSLTTDGDFPTDGDDQVLAAVLAKGASLRIGGDVIALQIRNAPFSVAGVVDVPSFAIGIAPGPTLDSNITIGARERAIFDAARVVQL